MKITYVVSDYCPFVGGIELYVQGIAERLAKRGHDVSVITSAAEGCRNYEEINGVKIARLSGKMLLFRKATYFPELAATIERIKPDVLHCMGHGHIYCVQSAETARKLGIPLFVLTYGPLSTHTIRGFAGRALSEIYDLAITPWLFRRASAVLYRTPNLKEWCAAKGAKKALLSITGIDEAFLLPPKIKRRGGKKTVGFVGTICRRKGIQHIVEAAPAILARNPEARFVVAGSSNTESDKKFEHELMERIRALGLEEAFDFAETVIPRGTKGKKNIISLFDSFDVVALPSAFEAPGQAILQAMARGKPVVVARIPQLEGIIGEENALFVRFGDSAGIAEKISELLCNGELRKEMGEANAIAAKRFSLGRLARELEEIYRGAA